MIVDFDNASQLEGRKEGNVTVDEDKYLVTFDIDDPKNPQVNQ